MTAILGLFHARSTDLGRDARDALRAMSSGPEGTGLVEIWQGEGAALGSITYAWQAAEGPDGARLAYDERAVVVTDASLYYTADLQRSLAAALQPCLSNSPAKLILAAYRAWGADAVRRLEGDFALLVWDRLERRLIAARDHFGTRPLFYTAYRGGLATASRLSGLAALPEFHARLDPTSLANDALFLRVHAPESTIYSCAKRLPAGHRITWRNGTLGTAQRWWEVPIFARGDGAPFSEAVGELRRLIVAAAAERMKHAGGTGSAVWLSGGYDSSTLFAASQVAAADDPSLPEPLAVSLSHPPDDPGYEDNFIEATTAFWRTRPTWCDATAIPALESPIQRAILRDEPFYHTYELWNAALAQTTQRAGRRVAIIGTGGDQFFSSSVIRLADHFRNGRFKTLTSEWREAGGGLDWRLFLREVVVPNIPKDVLAVAARLRRGRTPQHRFTRRVPSWANSASEHFQLLAELNQPLPRRPREGHAALEQSLALRHAVSERVHASQAHIGLLDGVEVRAPLFDSRVVRFAAARPLAESYSKRENKRLLRAAFRSDLPTSVVGPRANRTGLPLRYLERTAVAHAKWVLTESTKGMILADSGVIVGSKFLERTRLIAAGTVSDVEEGAALVAAVQTECWLRARSVSLP
ncbi:MAG: asparagine synthase-related protein [Gemmatimonadaceae bacterium]